MENKNVQEVNDFYSKYLNIPHRRLIVDDSFRLILTPPQKKLYPCSGCLLLRCPFPFSFRTCDKCRNAYNFLDL